MFIFSEKVLIQDGSDALGVDFPLEIHEEVGVVLFLEEIFFELALIAHRLDNMLVDGIDWSLVAFISVVGGLDIFWCCAQCVYR